MLRSWSKVGLFESVKFQDLEFYAKFKGTKMHRT